MMDRDHPVLSIVRQCELVSVNRSGLYHEPAGETAFNLALMRLIDAQFMETPWYGSRQMIQRLRREGHWVGRKRIRRLMAVIGLVPIYQRPRMTIPHPEHRIYPYLLRDLTIDRPNQVWCTDITLDPLRGSSPDAPRVSVSRRGHGLVDAQGAVLACVEHDGCGVLHRGVGGRAGPSWPAGDLQLRPGQPVHLSAVHQGPAGCGDTDIDGRQRSS